MIRADAFLTVGVICPVRKLFRRPQRLPILMYHSISQRKEAAQPYYRTVTSPSVFATQMKYLADKGYAVLGVQEILDVLRQERSCERAVMITFDDGYRDFYTNAFPILHKYGFSATVYLPTSYIGSTRLEFKGTECLNWNEVRELHRAGITFGSHTANHPQLRLLTSAQVASEVNTSKDVIEQQLGTSIQSFAYPYSFPEADRKFTLMLHAHLTEAGYESGVSTIIGSVNRQSKPFFLPRLPVNSDDGPRLFEAKLTGAYDWLHGFQYAYKVVQGISAR